MNITIRMIFSALVIFIGYMVVYLLGQPLEGMRGAPWFNYYVFEMPLVGLVVITVVLCILSPAVGDAVAVFCGSWIRGGGFWADTCRWSITYPPAGLTPSQPAPKSAQPPINIIKILP